MKKINIICIFITIAILSFWVYKGYTSFKIRPDIYNSANMYNYKMIVAVKNFRTNGIEDKELIGNIQDFIDKYASDKPTKKEKELLNALQDEGFYYIDMTMNKEHGETDSFNKDLASFEKAVGEVNKCLKK